MLEEPTPADDAALLLPNGEFEGLNDDCVDSMVELPLDCGTPLFFSNGGLAGLFD